MTSKFLYHDVQYCAEILLDEYVSSKRVYCAVITHINILQQRATLLEILWDKNVASKLVVVKRC